MSESEGDEDENHGLQSESPSYVWSSSPPRLHSPTPKSSLHFHSPTPSPPAETTSNSLTGKEKRAKMLEIFKELLRSLEQNSISFTDWLLYIFEPVRGSDTVELRRIHFWNFPDAVRTLLGYWTHAHQTALGRRTVIEWTLDFVSSRMRSEAQKLTSDHIFCSSSTVIGPGLIRNFKISKIQGDLQKLCGTSVCMLLAISGADPDQLRFDQVLASRQMVVMFTLIMLLCAFNRQNNLVQVVLSLYMYTAGLQRQAFSILLHFGLLISYSMLVSGMGLTASGRRPKCKKKLESTQKSKQKQKQSKTAIGPLKNLSIECVKAIRALVQQCTPIGLVFDNINMTYKRAEQVLGRTDTQENGTCATVFELFDPSPEALDYTAMKAAFLSAGPLKPADMLHTKDEHSFHRQLMIHNVLWIILRNGGDFFDQFQPLLEESQPKSEHLIPVHESKHYSLPAMDLDESSIKGVITVMDTMYDELGVDKTSAAFQTRNHLTGGDQKSLANMRAARDSRSGNDNPEDSFDNLVLILGLFHMAIAAVVAFLLTHFGNSAAGIHNPGSLAYHNSLIERKPITLSSLPPFKTSRALIDVSLFARILHCLTLVSGCATVEDYTKKLTVTIQSAGRDQAWAQLVADATEVFDRYTDIRVVEQLRNARALAKPEESAGDMVYENAILFMREGLNVRELTTSTKRGDSGRILNICKVFALSFRGSGRLKYANEMLTLIHHATTVWPAALRNLVLKNWLLNPTGCPDSFVPLDLVQEHGNLWIKTVYSAQGSNASWSWLSVISPCVEALRALARDLNNTLGSYMGRKHTSPDISMDIQKIIESLDRHGVYRIQPGRTLNGKDEPVPDIETLGSANTESNQTIGSTQEQLTETEDAESVAGSEDEADQSGEDEDELMEALKAPEEGGDGSDEEWMSSDGEAEIFEDGE
ncbi:hypothetical protein FRC08_010053 [Ceratobasidium sp. 394]|nr:hypothetical protein FRC08_010053 [Ceratobasidium sp. 394]